LVVSYQIAANRAGLPEDHYDTCAARHHSRDDQPIGDMITESMRADDPKTAAIAFAMAANSREAIRSYVALHASPDVVSCIINYVVMTLRGLSSNACLGYAQVQLVEFPEVAGSALYAKLASH
jgi:TetR/AcrR family transcriptional repressor for divergent bdcA